MVHKETGLVLFSILLCIYICDFIKGFEWKFRILRTKVLKKALEFIGMKSVLFHIYIKFAW